MIVKSIQEREFDLRKYVLAETNSDEPYIMLRGDLGKAIRNAEVGLQAQATYVIGNGYSSFITPVEIHRNGELHIGCQSFSPTAKRALAVWASGGPS